VVGLGRGVGNLGFRRARGVPPADPLPPGASALGRRERAGGELPGSGLPRAPRAARLPAGRAGPFPLGRVDGGEGPGILGVVAPGVPDGLRGGRDVPVPARGGPADPGLPAGPRGGDPGRLDQPDPARRGGEAVRLGLPGEPGAGGDGDRVVAGPPAFPVALGAGGGDPSGNGPVVPLGVRGRGDRAGDGPGGRPGPTIGCGRGLRGVPGLDGRLVRGGPGGLGRGARRRLHGQLLGPVLPADRRAGPARPLAGPGGRAA